MLTIKGRVTRVFFSGADFSAGVLVDSDSGRDVKFSGPCCVKQGDRVIFRGKMGTHAKYGPQLNVEESELDMALDADGLRDWLRDSPAAKGIGASRAASIASKFGDTFEHVIKTDPRRIATECRIPVAVIDALAAEWTERESENRAMVELAKYGVKPGRARRLIIAHGTNVVSIVRDNPYWLIGRVPGFGFKTVDKIAMGAGVAVDHPERIRHGILSIIDDAASDGHTWTAATILLQSAHTMLDMDGGAVDFNVVQSALTRMMAEGEIANLDGRLFAPATLDAEQLVARRFAEMGATPSGLEISVDDAKGLQPSLNDRQAEAVSAALSRRLVVISGGAGVGKTFTIETIVRALEQCGRTQIRLCAPTGKAAQRMKEVIKRPAQTIHQALKPSRVDDDSDGELMFAFAHDESAPLEDDVVIVDEVSMVDVWLMSRLLRAIDGTRTTLILVGDHNQLPSVGAGAVLRDVIATRPCPVVILDEVMRQAGELKRSVSGILDGRVAPTSLSARKPAQGETVGIAPWYVFGSCDTPDAVAGVVSQMIALRMDSYTMEFMGQTRAIDPVWDVQVLTPTHKGPAGTRDLNIVLQRIAQTRMGNGDVPMPKEGHRARPLIGDKVIWTKNDYKLNVMNGTMGRVLDKRTDGTYLVKFETIDDAVEIPNEKALLLDLAYALTIHKSQGSEFPVVFVVNAKAHSFQHHRGLLYTGASRARVAAIIVGDTWSISNCARTVSADKRRTLALPLALSS